MIVCCFYQHGSYIRDSLLAELLGLSLSEMFETTKDTTEGVVIYDCIDESTGNHGARARHRIIATVVWDRCGDPIEREALLRSSLTALNLNHQADKDAFENFIRSDRLIDNTIQTLDGKINFFETACRKDPESPYVRQHYARMLLREEKGELALDQIDKALKLNPHIRVLYHTKGRVLSFLAASIESNDLARRRLAQSEESYRRCLSMNDRDSYGYQGLAQLYFGWAKRSLTQEEKTEYLTKAEGMISEGLKKARKRDSLWIESANIQEWLGNEPSRIQALEQAVRTSPSSIIARYMLGRAHRKNAQPQKAIEVLESVIKDYHEEFRAVVEYALALLHSGKSYKEAIAVLRLSTLYGLSDPRFVATLGGMLFMDGQFTEAEKVFEEATKRNFTSTESHTVQFRPPDPSNTSNALQLQGKVAVVKAGYTIIESTGFPRFLCPGSKYDGTAMQQGMEISFEPAFTARGNIAERPRQINATTSTGFKQSEHSQARM